MKFKIICIIRDCDMHTQRQQCFIEIFHKGDTINVETIRQKVQERLLNHELYMYLIDIQKL
jgi:hypothetical protein